MAGVAEVRLHIPARETILRAAPPDRGDYIVAHLDLRHRLARFDDLPKGFVTGDQIIGPRRRRAVLKFPNFPVGAADADIQDFDFNVRRPDYLGFWMINQLDVFSLRERGD